MNPTAMPYQLQENKRGRMQKNDLRLDDVLNVTGIKMNAFLKRRIDKEAVYV